MWAMTLPVIFTALHAWPGVAFAVAAFWFGLVAFVGIDKAGANDGASPLNSVSGRRRRLS
jgi:hypothetical protein